MDDFFGDFGGSDGWCGWWWGHNPETIDAAEAYILPVLLMVCVACLIALFVVA